MPGETKYFGITYGLASVDEKNPNGPYILANNPKLKTSVNTNNEYDNVTVDLIYGNTSATTYRDAQIKMYLPENYMVADNSMVTNDTGTATGIWTRVGGPVQKVINGKTVNAYVWSTNIGALPQNANGTSVSKPVIISPLPQTGPRPDQEVKLPRTGEPKTAVVPVYAFELEYNGVVPDKTSTAATPSNSTFAAEYKYTHKDLPVEMPFVSPVNLNGKIWRDVNGDAQPQDNEGKVGVTARLTPGKTGANDDVVSVYTGKFPFENGYSKVRNPHELKFVPANLTEMEKYIWEFDENFTVAGGQQIVAGVPVFVTYKNPYQTGLNIFEKFDISTDELGNAKIDFKVKEASYDSAYVHFRMKELLAGKLSVIPYIDTDGNGQYDTTDKFINSGEYRLGRVVGGNYVPPFYTKGIAAGQPNNSFAKLTDPANSHKLVAFRDYKVEYKPAFGFRYALDGTNFAGVTKRNADSVLKSPNGTPIPIELIAKDIRFANASPSTDYPSIELENDAVMVPDTTMPGKAIVQIPLESGPNEVEKELKFNAWKGLGADDKVGLIPDLATKRATDFKWEVVSDPKGILDPKYSGSAISNDGKVTIKPNVFGVARLRVSFMDDDRIYDEMLIKVSSPLADPDETVVGLIVDNVTVDTGQESQLIQLKAKIQKPDGTFREEIIDPTQLDEFKPATNGAFIIKLAQNPDKRFTVKGGTPSPAGTPHSYTAIYNGSPLPVEGTVTVNEGQITPANYRLEIQPSPVTIKQGTNKDFKVMLVPQDGSPARDVTNEAITTKEVVNTGIATFAGATLTGSVVGETQLKATYGGLSATAPVKVYDDNTVGSAAEGKIGFVEVTNPLTNGVIPEGSTAEYKPFKDLDGDGVKDPGEPFINVADLSSYTIVNGGATATPHGTDPTIIVVTGNTAGTSPKLVATATIDNKLYAGEKQLKVIGSGQSVDSIKINPDPIIIKVGQTSDTARLLATPTGGGAEFAVERELFTDLTFANTHAAEVGNKMGLPIRVKGNSIGVTPIQATLAGKTADSKVVVIPADTKIIVDPTWVKKGGSSTVPVRFTGTGMTPEIENILKPLVRLAVLDPIATVGTNLTDVDGADVGATRVTAEISQIPGLNGTGDLYVYTDNGLTVEPTPVNVRVGEEARVNVFLTDPANPATKVPVPATQTTVEVGDTQFAESPSTPTTNHINVTGKKVGTTPITVKVPAANNLTATGNVNVTAGTRGLIVTPGSVTLYEGDAVGVEIITKDRTTGDIIPVNQLDFTTFSEAGKNKVEIRGNQAFLIKDQPSNGIVGDNILTVKVGSATGDIAGTVKIINNAASSTPTGKTYSLEIPNLVMYMGQPAAANKKFAMSDVVVVEKAADGTETRKPLSAYNPNKADIELTPNAPILSGSINSSPLAPPTELFELSPSAPGGASYKVTYKLATPSGPINIEGLATVAIYAQDPATAVPKIIITTPRDNGDGTTTDVEIDYANPVPVADQHKAKLVFKYPDGSEQIVGGSAIPAFVVGKLVSDDRQFEVAPNGELRGKSPIANQLTSAEGKIRVTSDTAPGTPGNPVPATSSRFTFMGTTPPPTNPNERLLVSPKQLVIPVGQSRTVTVQTQEGTNAPVPVPNPTLQVLTPGIATAGPNGQITGDAPGTTKVRVSHNGRIEDIDVLVVDTTNGKIGITEDPQNITPGVDPNDPTYPGGFIIPGEVIKVKVGGSVPFLVNINGITIPNDEYGITRVSGAHSDIDVPNQKVKGDSVGVDEVEVYLLANPAIKKKFTVIVYEEAPAGVTPPHVSILDKPNVFRATSEATRQIGAQVNLNGNLDATIVWIVGNTAIADIGGAQQATDGPSADTDRNITINWVGPETPASTKLIAIALHGGNQDETTLLGKQISSTDVQGFTGFSDPIVVDKNVPTPIDNAASTLDIKLVDNSGNEYSMTIADFDVISATGPLTLSGANNRVLTATDDTPKTVTLRHRTTGVEVVAQVKTRDELAPKGNITFNPGAGTLVGNPTIQVPIGQQIPASQIPTVTPPAGYSWTGWTPDPRTHTVNGDVTFTAVFTANPPSGGGGGGGSTPPPATPAPKPPTKPTDDKVKVPDALNSKDHIKYVLGYPDGTVRPQKAITRAEVATIFYRLLTAEARDKIFVPTNNFSDVRAANWYNKAVSSMNNGKYIQGYPNGTFGGNRNITRAEFVAIASRFMDAKAGNITFTDVKSNHWAKDYIATAVAYGWVNGYENGTFRPDQEITRAEAMAIVNRLLNRGVDAKGLEKVEYKDFRDNNKNAWYYYEVIEATNDHEYTGARPTEVWTSLHVPGYAYDVNKYERP